MSPPVVNGSPETPWLLRLLDQLQAEASGVRSAREVLQVARRSVLLRFDTGDLAAALGRAMYHLRSGEPGTVDLTIDAWIGGASALRLPGAVRATGTTHVDDGRVVLTWDAPAGPLVAYDRTARHAWMRFSTPDSVSAWERATPFRRVLHWWAADQGLQLAHAAAVGRASGGLLLVGRGGSGKSTTALACLCAGMGFAGDDYCLLEPGDPPHAYGLYLSAKGDARTAALLPQLEERLRSSPLSIGGKSIVFADDIRPAAIMPGFPLRGILVPRRDGGPISRVRKLRPAEALRAVAPSTLLQMPGERAGTLARLTALASQLPAWELCLGDDPSSAVPVLAEMLGGPP